MKTLTTLCIVAILFFAASCSKSSSPSKTASSATGVQGTWQYTGIKYDSKDGSKSDRVALMGSTLSLLSKPDFIFDEKGGLKIYDPKEKNYRTCQYTTDESKTWLYTTCDANKGTLKIKQSKDKLSLVDTLNKVTLLLQKKQ